MDIQQFITNFEEGTVQISSNVTYDQRTIIEKNYQMRNGQFEDPYFEDGETEKYYFNVVQGFCNSLIRGSRLRIAEFSLTSLNGMWMRMLDILKMGLRHFLKYNGFIDKKEEVEEELIEMGHVLTKIVDGEMTLVDLRNWVFRPDMKSAKLEGGAERIYLTLTEAEAEFGDGEHWKEIEEHYERISETYPKLPFIEFWTIDKFDTGNGEEITRGCIRYLDRSMIDPAEYDLPDTWAPYLELDKFASPHEVPTRNKYQKKVYGDTMRVFPYDEQRLINIKGRYLGMGAYEMCRPAQEDYNEKRNYKRKFDRLALRGILVHKIGSTRMDSDGEALSQEFLNRADTGTSVKIFSDESLERLNIGSTTNDTLAMTNDLFEFMRFMLGVTPIAIGKETSNKTAYYAMTQAQTQQTTYQIIKNKLARLFERLFQDFLLDDVIEDVLSKDVIPLYGSDEDLQDLDDFLARDMTYKDQNINSQEEAEQKIEALKKPHQAGGNTRFLKIDNSAIRKQIKKILHAIEWIAEFNIDQDEVLDPNAKINTLIQVDQIQDPKLKNIILDLVGIDPDLLALTPQEKAKQQEELSNNMNPGAPGATIPGVPATAMGTLPAVSTTAPNM